MNKKALGYAQIVAILIGVTVFFLIVVALNPSSGDIFEGTNFISNFFNRSVSHKVVAPDFDSLEISRVEFKNFVLHVNQNYVNFRGDDNRRCACGDNCERYANAIWDAANDSERPVNPVLVLSLMMQESNCRPSVSTESSIGILQINCGVWCDEKNKNIVDFFGDANCCDILRNDVERNIEAGVSILAHYYYDFGGANSVANFRGCNLRTTYSGWLAALRRYNGLGCDRDYTEQDFFVPEIVDRYNVLEDNI